MVISTQWEGDALDPAGLGQVPMSLRSVGRWVWPEAITYYLDHYDVTPVPGLYEHLLSDSDDGTAPAQLDEVARHRILATVLGRDLGG